MQLTDDLLHYIEEERIKNRWNRATLAKNLKIPHSALNRWFSRMDGKEDVKPETIRDSSMFKIMRCFNLNTMEMLAIAYGKDVDTMERGPPDRLDMAFAWIRQNAQTHEALLAFLKAFGYDEPLAWVREHAGDAQLPEKLTEQGELTVVDTPEKTVK